MIKRYFFLICLIGAELSSYACSCLATNFCESTAGASQVVIVEKIQSIASNGIQARVVETILGDSPSNMITIWGDQSGFFCGPFVEGVEDGSRLVIPLFISKTGNEPGGSIPVGDYFLPVCSNSLLPIREDQVEGYISTEEIQQMSLDRLRKTLAECRFPKVLFSPVEDGLMIRPLILTADNGLASDWSIELIDLKGQRLYRQFARKEETELIVRSHPYAEGLYLIKIVIGQETKLFKGFLGGSHP